MAWDHHPSEIEIDIAKYMADISGASKGAIMYVGFVFGRNYVILQN